MIGEIIYMTSKEKYDNREFDDAQSIEQRLKL